MEIWQISSTAKAKKRLFVLILRLFCRASSKSKQTTSGSLQIKTNGLFSILCCATNLSNFQNQSWSVLINSQGKHFTVWKFQVSWFYVKSMLVNVEPQNLPFLPHLEVLNFDIYEFSHFLKTNIYQINKIHSP